MTPPGPRVTDGIMIEHCRVIGTEPVADGIHVISFTSPRIAATVRPGQFVNVRAEDSTDPLLRRPFSVYRVEGDAVRLIYQVIGKGTAALSRKRAGDELDVLGPLGRPFTVDDPACGTALLVAGGLGVAPMPLTTRALLAAGKKVLTVLGARTASMLLPAFLEDVRCATDDGSRGSKGTAVDLARTILTREQPDRPKLYACGPTPMLRALAQVAKDLDVACELSLEGAMACGIGICQGCPVELVGAPQKYALMCKDGPTFDARLVRI